MNTRRMETGSRGARRKSAALPARARLATGAVILVLKADMASMVTVDCGRCV